MVSFRASPRAAAGVVAAAVLIAACGGGDGGDDAMRVQQRLTVRGQDTRFDVENVVTEPGPLTITFDNRDADVTHNIHVTGPGTDEKTEIVAGPVTQTLEVELAQAGTYTFVCDVHPQQMRGEIEVES